MKIPNGFKKSDVIRKAAKELFSKKCCFLSIRTGRMRNGRLEAITKTHARVSDRRQFVEVVPLENIFIKDDEGKEE